MSSMHVRGPTAEIWLSALQFLGQEVKHLDDQNWEGWLALYTPDAEYWVPAWDTDGSLVSDPSKHVSLIYYKNRGGLEDRIYRLRTGRSAAGMPFPRTSHQFQIIEMTVSDTGGELYVRTNWVVHSVAEHEVRQYFGTAHYTLESTSDDWRIKSKKTVVLNDRIDQTLDVYHI